MSSGSWLGWRVPKDIYDRFRLRFGADLEGIDGVSGATVEDVELDDRQIQRHLERAMRQYADLDDYAEAVDRLRQAVAPYSSERGDKEKNENRDGFSTDGPKSKVARRVGGGLKRSFKQYVHEVTDTAEYGNALARAMSEYLDRPRADRLGELVDDVEDLLEEADVDVDADTDPESGSDTDGSADLPDDARERLEETADQRAETVGATVRDRAAAIGSTLLARRDQEDVVDEVDLEIVVADHFDREPSTPTLRRYTELLVGALDLRPHPKHHENHAARFPDGDTTPDVTEYVFPETFRAIMAELEAADRNADRPDRADAPAGPPPDDPEAAAAAELDVLEAAEAVTGAGEDTPEADGRGRAITDGGEPPTDARR